MKAAEVIKTIVDAHNGGVQMTNEELSKLLREMIAEITTQKEFTNDVLELVEQIQKRQDDLKNKLDRLLVNSILYKTGHSERWSKEKVELFNEFNDHGNRGLPVAIKTLVKALQEDYEYFQSWKDNISMNFQDAFRRYKDRDLSMATETVLNFEKHNLKCVADEAAREFLIQLGLERESEW